MYLEKEKKKKNWTVNPLLNWFGSSNLSWPTIWVGSEVVKRGGTKQKESCLTNLKKYIHTKQKK